MGGADGDAVQGYAEDDDEPDGVDGGLGVFVYFGEEAVVCVYISFFSVVFLFLFVAVCVVCVAKELTRKTATHHHGQMRTPFEYPLAWPSSL